MSSFGRRIDNVRKDAISLPLKSNQPYVLISDCHRGDGNWNDNFSNNKIIYMAALEEYYKKDFVYIELGDGDELWENRNMKEIVEKHEDVFDLLKRFCCDNRMYMLYGNHDMTKKKGLKIEGFSTIPIHESIFLKMGDERGILLLHGHQGDLWNDKLWILSRFLVRHIWRPLEQLGIKDPTSASKNYRKKGRVETRLMEWAENREQPVIAGHTHRPYFPREGTGCLYFNTGSCVHPHSITALEIEKGRITLVKWREVPDDNGYVQVRREILAGPVSLDCMIS